MGTADLPHSTPCAEGVDAAGIEDFLDEVEAARLELHSLIALRHGRVIAEGWWSPYSADRPHLLYSLSKSFTATAAGFAVAEGILDLDATVVSYFPEFDAEITDPRSRAIKVRDVASMASGHLAETRTEAVAKDPQNPVRGFLLIPPDRAPGSVFAYNQPCTYSLAAIIQREAGQTLVDYLRPRLFDPVGIGEVAWEEHPPGRNLGYSGMYATTDALARLGQLYLQDGAWRGRQVLPPGWAELAREEKIDTPREPQPDWRRGYGFQFWRSRHGYRGDGAFGQFCLVLPEQDMVIAITAATENMQAILDAVWNNVLLAVDASEPENDADGRLVDRLSTVALPAMRGGQAPSAARESRGVTFVAGSAPVERPTEPGARVGPVIAEVDLRHSDRGYCLALRDGGGRLDVRVGSGEWAVSEEHGVPVAASGAWDDTDAFVADLVFLETPHRVRISCSVPGRALTVRWATTPLSVNSILQLHKPGPDR